MIVDRTNTSQHYIISTFCFAFLYSIEIIANQYQNERVFYVPFNTLIGYIRTATPKGMKGRMKVLSDIHYRDVNPHLASGLRFCGL